VDQIRDDAGIPLSMLWSTEACHKTWSGMTVFDQATMMMMMPLLSPNHVKALKKTLIQPVAWPHPF